MKVITEIERRAGDDRMKWGIRGGVFSTKFQCVIDETSATCEGDVVHSKLDFSVSYVCCKGNLKCKREREIFLTLGKQFKHSLIHIICW